MIPDVRPSVGSWQNLYTLSGFAPGTRLSLQNKSGGKALVWEGALPPTAVDGDDRHGYQVFMDGDPVKTGSSPAGVWVLYFEQGFTQFGRMCVQEYVA